jgi:cAMP-dependent protein kinase regulator
LSKGKAKVTVYKKNTDPNDEKLEEKVQFTKQVDHGVGFGELAIMYNDKRSATIEAVTDCQTYTLEGSIFKSIVVRSTIERRRNRVEFLNRIPLFGKFLTIFILIIFFTDELDKFQKLKVADGMVPHSFNKNDLILTEGDQGQDFYLIEEGQVECFKNVHKSP